LTIAGDSGNMIIDTGSMAAEVISDVDTAIGSVDSVAETNRGGRP
jgi:hypothetical protein